MTDMQNYDNANIYLVQQLQSLNVQCKIFITNFTFFLREGTICILLDNHKSEHEIMNTSFIKT